MRAKRALRHAIGRARSGGAPYGGGEEEKEADPGPQVGKLPPEEAPLGDRDGERS